MEFLVYYKGSNHFVTKKVNHAIKRARHMIYSASESIRFKFMLCAEVRIEGEIGRQKHEDPKVSRLFYLSYEALTDFNQRHWAAVTPNMLYTRETLPVPVNRYYTKEE